MRNSLSRAGKRSFWEKRIEQWKETGLSEVQYCRLKNIKIRSFRLWKRKIVDGNAVPTLVEVPLDIDNASPVSILSPCPQLRVVVDRHFRIEIEKGFDPEVFEQVVRVLRRI